MNNLNALMKSHGMAQGYIEQYNKMYKFALKEAGFNSFEDLKSMSDWLDVVIHAREVLPNQAYLKVREAYLLRFPTKRSKE